MRERATGWAPPATDRLGLAIDITAIDHRLNAGDPRRVQGVHWAINLVQPHTLIGHKPDAYRHSMPEAVAYRWRYLGAVIAATVPADPNQPIRIPQHPKPITGHLADLLEPADAPQLTDSVRRLAAHHPGTTATARLDRTGYRTIVTD